MEYVASIYERSLAEAAALLTLLALGLLVVELLWLAGRRRLNKGRLLEMLASYSTLPPFVIVSLLTEGALIVLYFVVSELAWWQIPVTWGSALAVLILVDFIYYWEHRCAHEVPVLWAAYHAVHHSSPDFNQSTAYRISFVDLFFSPLFYLPLVLLGFHPAMVLSALVFILAYQTWLHTECIGKLGWLDKIFNTPSNHRVHHGTETQYLDKNYGAVLMIWDRWFGTYQAEQERPTYGLTQPLNSTHPWQVHFAELGRLRRRLRAAPAGRSRRRLLFTRDV